MELFLLMVSIFVEFCGSEPDRQRPGTACPHCGAAPLVSKSPLPDDELAGCQHGAAHENPLATALIGIAILALLTVLIVPLTEPVATILIVGGGIGLIVPLVLHGWHVRQHTPGDPNALEPRPARFDWLSRTEPSVPE